MVIDSLTLKLRQIARFSSNVILDEMSSAKCRLLFGFFFFFFFFLIAEPLYHVHIVTSGSWQKKLLKILNFPNLWQWSVNFTNLEKCRLFQKLLKNKFFKIIFRTLFPVYKYFIVVLNKAAVL